MTIKLSNIETINSLTDGYEAYIQIFADSYYVIKVDKELNFQQLYIENDYSYNSPVKAWRTEENKLMVLNTHEKELNQVIKLIRTKGFKNKVELWA